MGNDKKPQESVLSGDAMQSMVFLVYLISDNKKKLYFV